MGVTPSRPPVANPSYTPLLYNPWGYRSFQEFYPFYLGEHSDKINRRLHLVGTSCGFLLLFLAAFLIKPVLIWYGVLQGFILAWVGHYIFERNRPATLYHPYYSVRGDLKLWYEVISGAREF